MTFSPPIKPNRSSGWFQTGVRRFSVPLGHPELVLSLPVVLHNQKSQTNLSPYIDWPKPTLVGLSLLQLLLLREFKQLAPFYTFTVHQTSPLSSGSQLQLGWSVFMFWPVTKKDIDQIWMCVRCMVPPLGYSQGVSPDLMGVQLDDLGWQCLATYPLTFLMITQCPKQLGQWPCPILCLDSHVQGPRGPSPGSSGPKYNSTITASLLEPLVKLAHDAKEGRRVGLKLQKVWKAENCPRSRKQTCDCQVRWHLSVFMQVTFGGYAKRGVLKMLWSIMVSFD